MPRNRAGRTTTMRSSAGVLLERFRTWRRRRKVSKAYGMIAHAELDKRVGFTPLMKKWELLERDGYIELTDGGTEWVWP